MATTPRGRSVPYVVASRPLVTTPAQAQRLQRPIVYIQGNIHSGEVEGKEALQAILRDLLFAPRPNALDSVVAHRSAELQRGRQREARSAAAAA